MTVKSTQDPTLWVDEYGDYLLNYAIKRVRNYEMAKDLVQDTYLSAVKGLSDFKGESTVRTWLTAILKRKIIDHYRKLATHKEDNVLDDYTSPFIQEGIYKGEWSKHRAPQEWIITEDSTIDNQAFGDVLRSCISKLPPKQAAVFSMKEIDEMESEDICKELDIQPSNFWVLMHRAKLQLRECMERNWFYNQKK